MGSEVVDGYSVNLELTNFKFSDEFRKKCLSRKCILRNLYILIMDGSGSAMGSYYFVLDSERGFISSDLNDGRDLNLVGYLPIVISTETLRFWALLENATEKHIWSQFTKRQCMIWLEIIKNRHSLDKATSNISGATKPTFYMDGRHITEKIHFYFALGESIHGPGGYYGGCLDSLSDCFCGGFGVTPPFTLELSHFGSKHGLIADIIEVLQEHKVTIVFKD